MSQVSFFDEINMTTFIFVAPHCQPEMKRLLPAAAVFLAWYEMGRFVGMHAYSIQVQSSNIHRQNRIYKHGS